MKKLNELDNCVKKGLLKKMPRSIQDAERSILRAKSWLGEAESAFKAKIYGTCLLAAYESIFHAARAILLKDGYRERSHYCIARYINEIYVKKGLLDISIINKIDNYRELRHNTAYGLESIVAETDASVAIKDANVVINAIEKLLYID